MKIIRARISGFCMGVRRAVKMALDAASINNIFSLGPLIHNRKVLEDLQKNNIKVLDPCQMPLPGSTVIIRAHGIPPQTEAELVRLGVNIIDATCPNVKASQMKAYAFSEKGYVIFLAGEKDHAEISGIKGYIAAGIKSPEKNFPCYIAANPEEAAAAAVAASVVAAAAAGAAAESSCVAPNAKTVLLGQTTISREEYNAIGVEIKKIFPETEIINSICSAVTDRQEALRELCGQTDAVIIAGGKNSANTKRLLSLAQELGKPSWLCESSDDIPPEIKMYETVGISAGASAPDSLVDEIETTLKKF